MIRFSIVTTTEGHMIKSNIIIFEINMCAFFCIEFCKPSTYSEGQAVSSDACQTQMFLVSISLGSNPHR